MTGDMTSPFKNDPDVKFSTLSLYRSEVESGYISIDGLGYLLDVRNMYMRIGERGLIIVDTSKGDLTESVNLRNVKIDIDLV